VTRPGNPETTDTVAGLRRRLDDWRSAGLRVGLVPTMGALHAGHRSLIRRARRQTDRVVVSVFVNPLQFEDRAQFSAYPRDRATDRAQLRAARVDLCFAPTRRAMLPAGFATRVAVLRGTHGWEGADRPGHFEGVATLVARLLSLAGPVRAYFGEKDAQQLAMVRRLVRDLGLPVEVVGCPTVREPDGVACSSRNRLLTASQRRAGASLPQAVRAALSAYQAGERSGETIARRAGDVIAAEPGASLGYAAVVDPDTFEPQVAASARGLVIVAARVGPVRLIDSARLGDRRLAARAARWTSSPPGPPPGPRPPPGT